MFPTSSRLRCSPGLGLGWLAGVLAVSAATAQVVMPPGAGPRAGHSISDALSIDGQVQLGFDTAQLAPRGATITGIWLRGSRHPAAVLQSFPQKSFTALDVDVHLLSASLPLNPSMSANRGATVAVHRGWASLPPLPAGPRDGSPAAWSVHLPFPQPVLVDPRQHATLVIEITASGTQTIDGYPLDAEPVPAAARPFGPRRANLLEQGAFPTLGGDPVLGGRLDFVACHATGPMVLLLGASASRLLPTGVALPLDLTPFGAPGESLLVSPDFAELASSVRVYVSGPVGVQAICRRFALVSLPIPNNPGLLGSPVFAQGMMLDGSNPLGVTSTNGIDVQIGRAPRYHVHALRAFGSTTYEVPPAIVRFDGVFR